MIELRPYQHHAIENLRRAISSGHKPVLLYATHTPESQRGNAEN
jgi:type I site-specific restriction endonuclease